MALQEKWVLGIARRNDCRLPFVGPCDGHIRPSSPRDAGGGQSHDLHLAAGKALDLGAILEPRCAVRSEAQFVTVNIGHPAIVRVMPTNFKRQR